MKQSNLTFAEGFLGSPAPKGTPLKMFDFKKAAELIREAFKAHPDLIAEAGLQGDWAYTGGVIFANGKPTNENYTFLSSNWAKPTLILSWDGAEQEEIVCEKDGDQADCKWDYESLKILGLSL